MHIPCSLQPWLMPPKDRPFPLVRRNTRTEPYRPGECAFSYGEPATSLPTAQLGNQEIRLCSRVPERPQTSGRKDLQKKKQNTGCPEQPCVTRSGVLPVSASRSPRLACAAGSHVFPRHQPARHAIVDQVGATLLLQKADNEEAGRRATQHVLP